MTTTLTPDEEADLFAAQNARDWPRLLLHVNDLCGAYYAAGLVEGDLGHDGTIQAEVEAT